MKHKLIIVAVCGILSSQAGAWGLGDIGGKVLQGAVTGAISGKSSDAIKQDATQTTAQEVNQQAQQNADANAVDPNTLEGAFKKKPAEPQAEQSSK
jgi:hypothetical protein